MTITARQAARTICKHGNWDVSNLKLQKILYLINVVHMGETGKPLIDDNFEAWQYGPVVNDLYHDVKYFGSDPIPDIFINEDVISANSEAGKFLKDGCEALMHKTPGELVALTHRADSAWSEAKKNGMRIIDNDDIKKEYKELYA